MAADEGKEIVLEEEPASVSALPSPSQEGAADQPLTPAAHQPSTPPPRAPDLPALDEESLGEADFFVQQGLLDDARELLEQLAGTYPGHPALAERFAILAAVEAGEAAEPAGAAEPVEPAAQVEPAVAAPPEPPSELAPHAVAPLPIAEGGVNFDLGKELASEFAAQAASPADEFQYSVGDVFSQFKKGIEQTVRPEDGETHYDLGIAYKEMGLLDDAVQEFETALAAGGRKKELDCLTMIGLCRMAQGLPSQAVEVFRRALGSDGLGIESAKALHLELGLAFEAAGDPQAALSTFQKIVRIDPGYREVAAAVARLRSGPGLPAAQGGPPGASLSLAP